MMFPPFAALGRARRQLAALGGVLLLVSAGILGVLVVSSASAGPSVFPGRSGRIQMVRCKIVGESRVCDRYAVINPDGSGFRFVGARRGGLSQLSLRWAHDGKRLLVGKNDLSNFFAKNEMYLATPEGRRIKTIVGGKQARRAGIGVATPDWLPGGKRVAFVGDTLRKASIYTIGVDGKGIRTVRVFPRDEELVTLRRLVTSPDGRRIAFVRVHNHDSYVIYVVNANGTGLRRLAEVCDLVSLDWFPAGNLLLGSWREPGGGQYPCGTPDVYHNPGIYKLSLGGGSAKPIHEETYEGAFPAAISPDGKRIVVAVHRAKDNGGLFDTIMVMRADGTGVRTIRQIERPQGFAGLTWQPLPRH